MELTKFIVDGATVVGVRGNLTGGLAQSQAFHDFFRALIDDGETDLIVNLGETSWANSSGIGMLIGAWTSARNAGGSLILTYVTGRILNVLKVTRLDLLFKVFETDEAAAKYLRERSGELVVA